MPVSNVWCRASHLVAALGLTQACSDPAPPEPEVASIELSVADTAIRFLDRLVVKATPQGALGVPLVRPVIWASVSPALLAIETLGANGDSARIRPSGVGTGEIRVSAGNVTRSFRITVKDTVYSVTLTPGALSLLAGDTLSFVATVPGPPDADRNLRWEVSDAAVLQPLPRLDSLVFRAQVRAAGAASVRATALADTTKSAAASITAQVGRLAFLTQPATTAREIPFNPRLAVVVQDASRNVSLRAANAVTISAVPSACDASLKGVVTVIATNGVAEFPGTAATARCPALVLSATADPPASPATSQAFSVTARGCNVAAPIGLIDTVSAVMESVDCIVMRGAATHNTHTYVFTVPVTTAVTRLSVDATASTFAPRIESRIWSADTAAFWTDSLRTTGTLTNWYFLGPGTYRLSVTAAAPPGSGAYTIASGSFLEGGRHNGFGPCRIPVPPEISFVGSPGPDCEVSFASRPGQSIARAYLVYLPPGKAVTVTNRPITPADDTYLEVFDVTNPAIAPTLIAFDDNSGGGVGGRDAQLQLSPAPSGRFLEIRALFLAATNVIAAFRLTISP